LGTFALIHNWTIDERYSTCNLLNRSLNKCTLLPSCVSEYRIARNTPWCNILSNCLSNITNVIHLFKLKYEAIRGRNYSPEISNPDSAIRKMKKKLKSKNANSVTFEGYFRNAPINLLNFWSKTVHDKFLIMKINELEIVNYETIVPRGIQILEK
jgi:hypothetical protein